ncbi:type II toxin-antitoxin system death-on-curing family toxin [Occultella aeris]|uniref:Toxin Doc n=1 Tax=Occultella aeris TaxID=2761496 RepID=A0A7M4DG15_9MICO|nr:Fic family protein [Occultella aeris]VZO35858.1 Toxin Doc [Occultella aeris]
MTFEHLSTSDLLFLFARVEGFRPLVRDLGALESAVERPKTTFGGHSLYPTLSLAAAALMEAINQNHPLVDGNKRLSWIGVAAMYALAGHRNPVVPSDDIVSLTLSVVQHELTLEEIAGELDRLLRKPDGNG